MPRKGQNGAGELEAPGTRAGLDGIATEVVSRGIVAEISGTTVWRWLSEDG
ncbi:MAG TPA: hypothetical protein VME20_09355 [Acidimicrobiales bacterium]|nr:hypothetical protein [Acidimicrobiales bacterium]